MENGNGARGKCLLRGKRFDKLGLFRVLENWENCFDCTSDLMVT